MPKKGGVGAELRHPLRDRTFVWTKGNATVRIIGSAKTLGDFMFCVWHIGSRGGSGAIPPWERFRKDMQLVTFDADPAAEIDNRTLNEWAEVEVHNLGIGGHDCNATLHVTASPTLSSFLAGADMADKYVHDLGQCDYELGPGLQITSDVVVPQRSIDSLIGSGTQPPNWLSIDAQGCEGHIIQGARLALSKHVVGLNVEVCFKQFYSGAEQFGSIHQRLSELGFELIDMQPIRGSSGRPPFGWRGAQPWIFADALYLRTERLDLAPTPDQLQAWAFAALSVGLTEVGFRVLELMEVLPQAPTGDYGAIAAFIKEATQVADLVQPVVPPDWLTVANAPLEAPSHSAWRNENTEIMKIDSQRLEHFLSRWQLHDAASAVRTRRETFFSHVPAEDWLHFR